MIKVGDKVKCIAGEYDSPIDAVGTVVVIDKRYYPSIGVRFDSWIDGHDLGGYCQFGYGWWLAADELVLLGGEENAL